ncbi:HAD superfamily hydrolase [Natronomonas pharaonis DSM 2160]|uniref:HAD superfamily hydrolase n=1 Tax=Natronomonas pharaonis (strain ATCC 35678 / DSM 2160 / CIP 103997 / JCM 8858 / NBRC 14720 / NCIMB 2260 / Gabara) TaxID=348780 RepID=A0A1U7EVJ5_NATPD|nr:HAD family hydrolase [Natronomonas pharaonis]CAI49039.1 HAD superfamily hydrolase [Natronomonas pharaonis DSM 2160]
MTDDAAHATDTEAVLWDIGGVLVELRSVREGYAAFVAELAADAGRDPDAALETWQSVLGDHFRGREGNQYRLARDGYEKATAALFDGDPPADWLETFEAATKPALRPEPGAVETVEALAEAGYRQAIVSDIDTPEAHRMLEAFGIRDRFDHITTSEAVGYTKPDERMFQDALSALDVAPERAVMVGDRHSHDVTGAAALGIRTVGYGEEAWGDQADHEIEDLREILELLGVES